MLEDTRKKLLDHMFSVVESLTSLFGSYEFISLRGKYLVHHVLISVVKKGVVAASGVIFQGV